MSVLEPSPKSGEKTRVAIGEEQKGQWLGAQKANCGSRTTLPGNGGGGPGGRALRHMHTRQAEDGEPGLPWPLGNGLHERLELQWVQAYRHYLGVFIFLLFLSDVFLKHGETLAVGSVFP